MDVIYIFAIILVCLFVSSFMAKRRFGLLGLALAAGSLLSGIWGYDAGLTAGFFGIPLTPVTTAIISSLIIILPALFLMFHGYTYKTKIGRVFGSVLFAFLAFAFLIKPIGNVLALQGIGVDVYSWITSNNSNIIGICLVIAIVDLFCTKPAPALIKKT